MSPIPLPPAKLYSAPILVFHPPCSLLSAPLPLVQYLNLLANHHTVTT
ncbi:hypothetical protein GXM_01046 [Nostoc sphaeroides CCNUC1]|uniref:Uncharacterized protein n=1 Tax=Nostoc sphaeroides CCNUC1 TaxID=2653204 RepID=A0A5P8VT54_9NOSO|nr:hypothetical protein GXM_01046 [Nostoc sphaeroides CCNUC1]